MANMGFPQSLPNHNEAGEPLIDAAALRLEQELDSDPSAWWCDDCGRSHYGRCPIYY